MGGSIGESALKDEKKERREFKFVANPHKIWILNK
jgi:hypothetical protein